MNELMERLRRVMRLNEESTEILDRLEWRITKKGDEAMMKLLKRTAVAVLLALLSWASPASAEMQGLYLNIDNRSWTLVSTHISEEECDKAARRAMRERKALGAGCAPFTPAAESKEWRGQAQDNYKSDRQQRIEDRQQIYDNRRERYERQFTAPTPR